MMNRDTRSMTAPRTQRAWPGALDWGGDWLAEAESELSHLGFVLRDGSSPGTIPGPRLLVALRRQPTLEHFDPETVTFVAGPRRPWASHDGRAQDAGSGGPALVLGADPGHRTGCR